VEQFHQCCVCQRRAIKLYREYGLFLRDEEIYCKAHKPDSEWIVPLVEDEDGSVWGYSSAPPDAIQRSEALPE
jgi:hypothetical protein